MINKHERVRKMPLVSVIVPAYNAENTVEKTIQDILAQSFQDFEVILVDDGSKDNTPAVCDKLGSFDSRIQVIHQVNGGLSNARNNGTIKATGEYVTYIDSDDRIEPAYLEYLVRAITEEKADISCARIDRVKEDYELGQFPGQYCAETFDKRETLSEMLTGKKLTVGACCRLVPREWQLKNPFLDGTYYEDLSNTYKVNMLADKTVFVDAVLYHYVMRGGSITGRKVTSEKQCVDYNNAIDACYDTVMTSYPELENDAAVLKARDYMSLYLSIQRCREKNGNLLHMQQKIKVWMKKNWIKAAKNEKAPKEVRLRILLFRINPTLYEKIYYIGIRAKGKAIS